MPTRTTSNCWTRAKTTAEPHMGSAAASHRRVAERRPGIGENRSEASHRVDRLYGHDEGERSRSKEECARRMERHAGQHRDTRAGEEHDAPGDVARQQSPTHAAPGAENT